MQRRRSNAVFSIAVTVVMALGAVVMAVVLLLSGAPGALVTGLFLAALPVGPLVATYLWLDRYEPEPRSLLALGLGWGAFVATSIALVLQVFDRFLLGQGDVVGAVVVAPFTEEGTKGLFILLLLFFRRHELDGILDGIVYAGMVGIGFAFTENILYLTSAYMGQDGQGGGLGGAVGLFLVRCVFGPFAHPFFTAFTGIGIGIAVNSRSTAVRFLAPLGGYLVAVGAHAAWNGSLMIGGGSNALVAYVFLMVPAFLLMAGFAIWARQRERGSSPRRSRTAPSAGSCTRPRSRGWPGSPRAASPGGTPPAPAARPHGAPWSPTRARPSSSVSCTAATCAASPPPTSPSSARST